MGDRNIVVLEFSGEHESDLCVYTHWTGSYAREIAEEIVASTHFQSRMNMGDESYAARIFVDQFTRSARDEETGYGLYPIAKGMSPERFAESETGIVRVNLATGRVH